jgi:ParB family chromosome partitioning protein
MTRPAPPAAPGPSNLLGAEIAISLSQVSGLDRCHARSQEPADGVGGLAASLAARGQLAPLIVRPDRRGGFTLLAGARRLRALLANAGPGPGAAHAATGRVRVFNGDDDEARALSLAENACREALHPLDEAEAFEAVARAHGLAAAARDFGLTEAALRRRLALAALSPNVKAAWRGGRLSLAAAEAFAADPAHAAQDALLAAPDAASLLGSPLEIRRRLISRFIPASAAVARFVGLEAYVAAGGELVEDLFGAEPQCADPALLRRLAREKLAAEAQRLRAEEGWGFVADDWRGFDQAVPDFLPGEIDASALAQGRLADPDVVAEAREAAAGELARIERLAALRAVPAAERWRYGIHVSYDSECRLAVERGLFRPDDRRQGTKPSALADRARSPGLPRFAGTEDGGRRPEDGETALEPSASASGVLPDDGERTTEDGKPAPPSSVLRPPDSGRRPLYVPAADAPLAYAARRVAEKAGAKAIADVVAGSQEFALAAAIAACASAGPHRRPVRIVRDHGPRGARTPWLPALARLTFPEALAAALAHPLDELLAAWTEIVASSIELRGADPDYNAALLRVAEDRGRTTEDGSVVRPLSSVLRIAEHFDYPAFFREASRATALLAIRDVGGEALERGHAWREDSALAEEAARLARAREWLPAFLRTDDGRRTTDDGGPACA